MITNKNHIAIIGIDTFAVSDLRKSLKVDYKIYGELFNREDPDVMEDNDREGVLIKVEEDPILFLQGKVYNRPKVGFCLVYGQCRSASWSRVWLYLKTIDEVLIPDVDADTSFFKKVCGDARVDDNFLRSYRETYKAKMDYLLKLFPENSRLVRTSTASHIL